MTIKELYEWAKEQGKENYEIMKLSAFADTVKTHHQATNIFLMTNLGNYGFFMSEVEK